MTKWLFCLLLATTVVHANETLVTLDTRSNVTQQFLLLGSENPVAGIILFAGGHGNLKLGDVSDAPTIGWGRTTSWCAQEHCLPQRVSW